jgi:replicative DNA helicase
MPDAVNELVVIAAALVDQEQRAKLTSILPPDSFYAQGHPEAWAAITEMERKGLHYDPATIRQISGGSVDTDYLDTLIAQRPAVPPNLAHHVEMLRWDRTRVEAIRGPVSSLVEALRDPKTEPERLQALSRQVQGAFAGGFGSQKYLRDPQRLVAQQMASLRARRAGSACFPFGIPGLDIYDDGDKRGQWRMVPGLKPQQVTVITGVPGSGKTTVTARIALAQANYERRVLFGAWEQGSGATLELCAGMSLGFSRTRLQVGDVTEEEEQLLEQEMERLAQWITFFEIPFGRTQKEKQLNDRNLDLIHEMIVTSGCEVAIFDLWRRSIRQFDPDEEEAALYRQQSIAQETGAHCVLLHQQRMKDLEQRADRRPTREGLKGSGAWVEVPDTIIGVHREALFKDVADNALEGIVLKQRHGVWPLAVQFDWDPDTGLITNGRSVVYDRPGQSKGLDAFLDEGPVQQQRKGAGGGRRKKL